MGMGPFAVESRLQRIKNVSLTREEAFKIFMDYTHWRVDARLVSDYINKSASTIEWLEEMGVEFVDVIAYVQGSYFTHHIVKGASGRPGPQATATMMKALTDRAKELGAQILFQTSVKKLVKEKGRIVGLMAEDKDEETIKVNAKAVIIATGGFGDNPEMIKKYTPYEWGKDIFSIRVPGMTGEGIRMAWEVGAGAEGMNMEITCGIPGPADAAEGVPMPGMMAPGMGAFRMPNLLVNLQGERFMNEGIMGNPTFLGNAVARQKNRCGFIIFDGAAAKYYAEHASWGGIMFGVPRGTKIDVETDVKRVIEAGHKNIFMADSLEELASKTGINLNGLKETVEEYNKACETGRDEIFHKSYRYLLPIKQPKFYAGRYFPTAYGSLGGIKINYKTEVVTKDHDVIPGLYAAGVDANAIYADSYIFILPGNTMSFALNGGRIAGENAAEYIKTVGK